MNELIESLRGAERIGYSDTFELYRLCAQQLVADEPTGINILISLLDAKAKLDCNLDPMLADLIESVGFYPYLQREELKVLSTSAMMRMAGNRSDFIRERIFHDEQKRVLHLLQEGKNIVVSAPTSFGKSLLIEEMVASKQFKNIVIIQPTLALLDETRRKLAKYRESYKLILRTSQTASQEKGNIFLFTSERVNEYPQYPAIDFLVVDEFYKLSARRDDERSDSLNNALLYLLSTFSPQFYLAGPNIDQVSTGFLEKYNATFFNTTYNLVNTETVDIYSQHLNEFGDRGKKKLHKEKILFELLDKLSGEQTLVYCASPGRARSLARAYLDHLKAGEAVERNMAAPIFDWIAENVSPTWCLIELIKYGVGFHDGALQRHITSTIIDYFDSRKLSVIFCTATIIEGVNTNAKNVVYFDQRKGKDKPIDYFDYANIRGRAGRLMEHYVGRVYNFGAPPQKDQINIDIPFVDQSPIADEVLINLAESEVNDPWSDQYLSLNKISPEERELFALNSINIKGQINLLESMRDRIVTDYDSICWDRMPTYEQLAYSLGLAWDCLRKSDENVSPMTKKWIVKLTFDYGRSQNINEIVKSRFDYSRNDPKNSKKSDDLLMDDAIRDSFQIMRHWFQYKIPKWLLVVDRIQKFVCAEKGFRPGSYIYYATLLENDFVRENMSILAEFGVPRSAIVKLSQLISADLDQDEVLLSIARRKLMAHPELSLYEREKLQSALNV